METYLRKWKKYFTFAAVLSCFVNILALIFPFYMFTIYRNIVISYSLTSLANITTAAFIAVICLGFFTYVRSRLLAYAGRDLNLTLRQSLFSATIKGASFQTLRTYLGSLNDLEAVQNYFSSPAIYSLFDAPWSPFFLAIIYTIQPTLGCIATVGAVIMVGLSILQELLIHKSMKEANILNAQNQRFVDSFIRNTEVINGMGMIGAISDRFVRANNRVIMNQTISSNYAGAIQAMLKPLQNVTQVLIYCAGAYYAMTEGFNVGLMVAASIIMGRGLAPLMQVTSSWQTTSRTWDSYRRLEHSAARIDEQGVPMALPQPQGNLRVEHALHILGGRKLIDDVSFSLAAGEFLGIIGPSGAGKTTLCRMLLGVAPSFGGKVYLDGVDIFSWNKDEVGDHIGYLPQEIELFPGTVAENIARLGSADSQEMARVMEICGIREMVDQFPDGLETQLEGKDGLKLSGGQKQRIGLARAVYKSPKFLVMDEPTSNLDDHGEQQLLNFLVTLKEAKSCTCIMVTHKPSLLQSMDKVLVLQSGRIALFGPKDDVFAKMTGQKDAARPETAGKMVLGKVSA